MPLVEIVLELAANPSPGVAGVIPALSVAGWALTGWVLVAG